MPPPLPRRAKIIATIGPASAATPILRDLVRAGMDVARLNFAHADHPEHARLIESLRQVAQDVGRPVGILQDLQGPKLRTGSLVGDKPVDLLPGQTIVLTPRPVPGSTEAISVNYPRLVEDVRVGNKVFLDDGQIELEVEAVRDEDVVARVVVGGLLGQRKGLSLPGVRLSAPIVSAKDRADLAFGLDHGVDAVAMSFVRGPEDVRAVQREIEGLRPSQRQPPIIAKLERPEALTDLDAILEACDGVMVARGDLGIEVAAEKLPALQKDIIRRANARSRMVITATQMLESMVHKTRPTRAEASDVANAVFDGTDALMLSAETAIGRYPVQSIETMDRIITDAEAHASEWGYRPEASPQPTTDDARATVYAARELAHDRDVAAIAVFTRSGNTARLMSKTRARIPILAFTPEVETFRQMTLLWGVRPYLIPVANSVEEMVARVEEALGTTGEMSPGQQVVLVASLPVGAQGPANFTHLHTLVPRT